MIEVINDSYIGREFVMDRSNFLYKFIERDGPNHVFVSAIKNFDREIIRIKVYEVKAPFIQDRIVKSSFPIKETSLQKEINPQLNEKFLDYSIKYIIKTEELKQ